MAQRIPKGVKQREFAQKLIDKGKSRMQVVDALVEKMNMTKGYATTMVYRWFIGSEFKASKKEIKAAPKVAAKSQKVAKAPGAKKAATSKKPKSVSSKNDQAVVKPKTAKKAPAKESTPESREVEGVDVFDAPKKTTKKSTKKALTAAERTTKIADDAAKAAKKTVAAAKKAKKTSKTANWEFD